MIRRDPQIKEAIRNRDEKQRKGDLFETRK